MKYKILRAFDLAKLEVAINEKLAEGWHLYGELHAVTGDDLNPDGYARYHWAQAMTWIEPYQPPSPFESIITTTDTGKDVIYIKAEKTVGGVVGIYPSVERGDIQD